MSNTSSPNTHSTPELATVVYDFPNGFRNEAQGIWGWLHHYGFSLSWGQSNNGVGGMAIAIPQSQVNQLRILQRENPARFGRPPDVNEASEVHQEQPSRSPYESDRC